MNLSRSLTITATLCVVVCCIAVSDASTMAKVEKPCNKETSAPVPPCDSDDSHSQDSEHTTPVPPYESYDKDSEAHYHSQDSTPCVKETSKPKPTRKPCPTPAPTPSDHETSKPTRKPCPTPAPTPSDHETSKPTTHKPCPTPAPTPCDHETSKPTTRKPCPTPAPTPEPTTVAPTPEPTTVAPTPTPEPTTVAPTPTPASSTFAPTPAPSTPRPDQCSTHTVHHGESPQDVLNRVCGTDHICTEDPEDRPTVFNADNIACPDFVKHGEHVRVCCVHEEDQTTTVVSGCPAGQSPVSVEYAGTFCTSGPVCVDSNHEGSCPGPQSGLEHGSICGLVGPEEKVYGCKLPEDDSAISSIKRKCKDSFFGRYPVSVEGIGTFCGEGPKVCAGIHADGMCPGKQEGLPQGSYCGVVESGVYGCKAGERESSLNHDKCHPSRRRPKRHHSCHGSEYGPIGVSVQGIGTFCVSGPVCAGPQEGNCPVSQGKLTHDSECVLIRENVYGCVVEETERRGRRLRQF